MNVITISREMGSGGTALGRLLARRLGFALIDKELILRVARKAHVSSQAVAPYDQEAFNRGKVVLESVFAGNPSVYSPLSMVHFPLNTRLSAGPAYRFNQERYLAVTQQLLKALARLGKVILLGRGGQIVLADHRKTLHLRVVAPLETRVERVCRGQGISEDEARTLIRSRDQACARYLKHFYNRDWNDPLLYDFVINTERLRLPSVVAMVLRQFQ